MKTNGIIGLVILLVVIWVAHKQGLFSGLLNKSKNGTGTAPQTDNLNLNLTKLWDSKMWKNGKPRAIGKGKFDTDDPVLKMDGGFPDVKIDGQGNAMVSGTSPRLFVFVKNVNTDIITYFKVPTGGEMGDIQLSSRSNHQDYECGFGRYEFKYMKDGTVSLEKEALHPIYKRHLDEKKSTPITKDKWIGMRMITKTVGSGVLWEGYLDHGSGWQKVTSYTDNGQIDITPGVYQAEADKCKGKGDKMADDLSKPFLGTGTSCWIRVNGAKNVMIKDYSVSEIAGAAGTAKSSYAYQPSSTLNYLLFD